MFYFSHICDVATSNFPSFFALQKKQGKLGVFDRLCSTLKRITPPRFRAFASSHKREDGKGRGGVNSKDPQIF